MLIFAKTISTKLVQLVTKSAALPRERQITDSLFSDLQSIQDPSFINIYQYFITFMNDTILLDIPHSPQRSKHNPEWLRRKVPRHINQADQSIAPFKPRKWNKSPPSFLKLSTLSSSIPSFSAQSPTLTGQLPQQHQLPNCCL
jgi:hypothetical protein